MPRMSRSQSKGPSHGTTSTSVTCVFARFASEAFSRAICSAVFGMSNERIVNDHPREVNVPEVCVSRRYSRLAHAAKSEATAKHATSTGARRGKRAEGVMRLKLAEPPGPRKARRPRARRWRAVAGFGTMRQA